jgi:D-xylose 1-dehydrogenase
MANSANYPSLKDRAVLVTGGAMGIGEAIVRAFAAQGAKVGPRSARRRRCITSIAM